MCLRSTYRYTQINMCIYLQCYLLRSHKTKKITDGTKGHREITPVGLQSTPQLEGLATGGSSKDSELTFSRVMEGISFDGSRVTPGPAEAPLTPFSKC